MVYGALFILALIALILTLNSYMVIFTSMIENYINASRVQNPTSTQTDAGGSGTPADPANQVMDNASTATSAEDGSAVQTAILRFLQEQSTIDSVKETVTSYTDNIEFKTINPIDKIMEGLSGNLQIANLIFLLQVIYWLLATLKGNSTLGFRFASPLFYPMRANETQLNSFIFNMFILNVSSLAITLYCCEKMPSYTHSTYIYRFSQVFLYSDLMYFFTKGEITGWCFIVLGIFTIFLNICRGHYRITFNFLEKRYSKNGLFKSSRSDQ